MDRDTGHRTILAQDATTQYAATQDTADAAGKSVQSKSPLLSLPAEIRNKIYRYLMTSHCGIIMIDSGTIPIIKDDDPEDWKVSIDTPLLGTCHQIYREASVIMYGENFFRSFCSNIYNPFDFPMPNFPMPNFKLLQNLQVDIDVTYEEPSAGKIFAFLSTLVVQQCSFKNLSLCYYVASQNEREFLAPTFGESTKLLEPTCAINVQCQLEMVFECWGLDETSVMFLRGHVVAIAARKSWTATETNDYAPSYEIRYLLHPGKPMPSKKQ